MKHPLAEEIKKWADDPEAWQWQTAQNPAGLWCNVTFEAAVIGRLDGLKVRIIPKRNLIPAHLLPDGWEVERLPAGQYRLKNRSPDPYTCNRNKSAADNWLHALLRHIDPEST